MSETLLTRWQNGHPKDKNEKIAFGILDDMIDRQGFDGFWGRIDESIQTAILESWITIIEEHK